MEAKHTKGEWFACCTDATPHFVFSEDKTICRICHNDPSANKFERLEGTVTIEECRANAKLIAAAPDMLEALILMDKHNSIPPEKWDVVTYNACQLVKEVIKKATI